jgi:hypothetical protein
MPNVPPCAALPYTADAALILQANPNRSKNRYVNAESMNWTGTVPGREWSTAHEECNNSNIANWPPAAGLGVNANCYICGVLYRSNSSRGEDGAECEHIIPFWFLFVSIGINFSYYHNARKAFFEMHGSHIGDQLIKTVGGGLDGAICNANFVEFCKNELYVENIRNDWRQKVSLQLFKDAIVAAPTGGGTLANVNATFDGMTLANKLLAFGTVFNTDTNLAVNASATVHTVKAAKSAFAAAEQNKTFRVAVNWFKKIQEDFWKKTYRWSCTPCNQFKKDAAFANLKLASDGMGFVENGTGVTSNFDDHLKCLLVNKRTSIKTNLPGWCQVWRHYYQNQIAAMAAGGGIYTGAAVPGGALPGAPPTSQQCLDWYAHRLSKGIENITALTKKFTNENQLWGYGRDVSTNGTYTHRATSATEISGGWETAKKYFSGIVLLIARGVICKRTENTLLVGDINDMCDKAKSVYPMATNFTGGGGTQLKQKGGGYYSKGAKGKYYFSLNDLKKFTDNSILNDIISVVLESQSPVLRSCPFSYPGTIIEVEEEIFQYTRDSLCFLPRRKRGVRAALPYDLAHDGESDNILFKIVQVSMCAGQGSAAPKETGGVLFELDVISEEEYDVYTEEGNFERTGGTFTINPNFSKSIAKALSPELKGHLDDAEDREGLAAMEGEGEEEEEEVENDIENFSAAVINGWVMETASSAVTAIQGDGKAMAVPSWTRADYIKKIRARWIAAGKNILVKNKVLNAIGRDLMPEESEQVDKLVNNGEATPGTDGAKESMTQLVEAVGKVSVESLINILAIYISSNSDNSIPPATIEKIEKICERYNGVNRSLNLVETEAILKFIGIPGVPNTPQSLYQNVEDYITAASADGDDVQDPDSDEIITKFTKSKYEDLARPETAWEERRQRDEATEKAVSLLREAVTQGLINYHGAEAAAAAGEGEAVAAAFREQLYSRNNVVATKMGQIVGVAVEAATEAEKAPAAAAAVAEAAILHESTDVLVKFARAVAERNGVEAAAAGEVEAACRAVIQEERGVLMTEAAAQAGQLAADRGAPGEGEHSAAAVVAAVKEAAAHWGEGEEDEADNQVRRYMTDAIAALTPDEVVPLVATAIALGPAKLATAIALGPAELAAAATAAATGDMTALQLTTGVTLLKSCTQIYNSLDDVLPNDITKFKKNLDIILDMTDNIELIFALREQYTNKLPDPLWSFLVAPTEIYNELGGAAATGAALILFPTRLDLFKCALNQQMQEQVQQQQQQQQLLAFEAALSTLLHLLDGKTTAYRDRLLTAMSGVPGWGETGYLMGGIIVNIQTIINKIIWFNISLPQFSRERTDWALQLEATVDAFFNFIFERLTVYVENIEDLQYPEDRLLDKIERFFDYVLDIMDDGQTAEEVDEKLSENIDRLILADLVAAKGYGLDVRREGRAQHWYEQLEAVIAAHNSQVEDAIAEEEEGVLGGAPKCQSCSTNEVYKPPKKKSSKIKKSIKKKKSKKKTKKKIIKKSPKYSKRKSIKKKSFKKGSRKKTLRKKSKRKSKK